jgi:Zn-dependent protease with chaperone function
LGLLGSPSFGQSAALFGKSDISVVRTQYFDVIYPAESVQTAAVLADNVDALYEKAAALLQTTPEALRGRWGRARIPLVVARASDNINAYYTPLPYNRIVVYDTIPVYDLGVQHDTLLSVVYHEIIHLVSMNMKNPGMQGASRFFGDIWNAAFFLTKKTTASSADGLHTLQIEVSKTGKDGAAIYDLSAKAYAQ